MSDNPVHAPEFPDDLTWVHGSKPEVLGDPSERDAVVVIAFWSHSDVTSINLFNDLKTLNRDIGRAVSLVSIYAPMFDYEKDRDVADHAVKRLRTSVPVALDFDGELRRRYGISGTPALLLLAPDGNVVGTLSGETRYDQLREAVVMVLEEHEMTHSSSGESRRENPSNQSIAYPRGIAYSEKRNRLAVADTSNHRVRLFDPSGEQKQTIGGTAGDEAGDFDLARFCYPHGLEFSEEGLYVCDAGNHRVKGIDFDNAQVHNLIGNGQRGGDHDYRGQPDDVGLMTPYDLVKVKNSLWITMAGGHQVWRYQILEEQFDSWLGTGAEGFQDGPHSQVTMAQPTGICSMDETLYFIDSRTSALRKYDPEEDWVETLIGQGMFRTGDVDGAVEDALMNFPLGIDASEDELFITDAFNHKVKKFDPEDGEIESWVGSGEIGSGAGVSTSFFEPSAVACGSEYIYVTDSNNSRCLAIDRQSWESTAVYP